MSKLFFMVIEKLAKQQFIQSGRDPHACFLFYAALNKSKLLAGLFQISRDVKSRKMSEFLKRDFQEERWKSIQYYQRWRSFWFHT